MESLSADIYVSEFRSLVILYGSAGIFAFSSVTSTLPFRLRTRTSEYVRKCVRVRFRIHPGSGTGRTSLHRTGKAGGLQVVACTELQTQD